jgi:hypothetical protein
MILANEKVSVNDQQKVLFCIFILNLGFVKLFFETKSSLFSDVTDDKINVTEPLDLISVFVHQMPMVSTGRTELGIDIRSLQLTLGLTSY